MAVAVPGLAVSDRHSLVHAVPNYGQGTVIQNPVLGLTTASTVGFYGVTAISQRAGAAQATSLVGTASSADVTTDVKAFLIEVGNALVALGVWKGDA